MALSGVDVSNWQGTVKWPDVAAAGYAFGFAKCTEGTVYHDPTFAANWHGMRATQITRGAYHYAQPDLSAPEAEAAYFVKQIAAAGGLAPTDLVALDIEAGTSDLRDWALRWLQAVEAAIGFRPLLYSSLGFMQEHGLVGDTALAEYGLWLAAWGSQFPAAPAPWSVVAFWQSSDAGSVPGIAGSVDLDEFNGDAQQLAAYGAPDVAPPAPPPPAPTNDDLVACVRFLLAQPPDLAGLQAYLQPFTEVH